jgi:hypothetical protein
MDIRADPAYGTNYDPYGANQYDQYQNYASYNTYDSSSSYNPYDY